MTKTEKHFHSLDYDVAFLLNKETQLVDQVVVLGFNEEGDSFHSEPIQLALPMRLLRKDGIDND